MESPQRRWRTQTMAAVAIPLLWICELQLRVGGPEGVRYFANVGLVAAGLVAAVSCGARAWRDRRGGWLAWGCLAASATSWAAGRATWIGIAVAPGAQLPFPSVADAGSLVAVPLLVAGLI